MDKYYTFKYFGDRVYTLVKVFTSGQIPLAHFKSDGYNDLYCHPNDAIEHGK